MIREQTISRHNLKFDLLINYYLSKWLGYLFVIWIYLHSSDFNLFIQFLKNKIPFIRWDILVFLFIGIWRNSVGHQLYMLNGLHVTINLVYLYIVYHGISIANHLKEFPLKRVRTYRKGFIFLSSLLNFIYKNCLNNKMLLGKK